MKKITFLFILLTVSIGFSQSTHTIDFEATGVGSGWAWTTSEVNPTFAEIANPVSGGINTSATVVQFVAKTTDMNWALCYTDADGQFTFDATNSTVKIMVYKPTISNVAVKFEGSSPPIELAVANTVTNQWEELTIDFSGQIGNTYNRMVIIPDFVVPYVTGKDRTTNNTVYFDNIQVPDGVVQETCSDGILNNGETAIDCGGPNCGPCPSPPTTAAPTPPARVAADVVSIYSDAYSSITPINYDAGWCGSPAIVATTAGGNAVLAYKNQACQGIAFPSALQNLTGFTHLHVDLFIEAGTDLVGKVFNMKAVPTAGGESAFNMDINGLNPKPVPGTWFSYDMPITFSGPTVDIKEFGVTSNLQNKVWYDNLYFHKNTALGTKDFEIAGLNVYPNPSKNSWTIKTSNINMSAIKVYDILGKNVLSITPNAADATINGSSLKAGLYFAQIKTANGVSSIKLVKE